MNPYVDYVINSKYLDNESKAKHISAFINANDIDKEVLISEMFGIFDGSLRNNTYTYYFWSSDVSIGGIYNYSGKRREREWRKLAKCYRVDWNLKTDDITVKQTRWNKRCVENADRKL